MNDQQICIELAKRPRSRASDLANLFNVELTIVSSALRSLVDVGDLVKSKEFDDNGRQSQVYELSAEFRKSREGKALLAAIDWQQPVQGVADIAPPPSPAAAEPEAAPAPVAPTDQPRVSKVQMAIDYLTIHHAATNDQLRAAMGLPEKAAPGAYLASALNSGRVMREGDQWKLGAGRVAPTVYDSVEKVGNIIVATRDATPVPARVVAAIAVAPALAQVPGKLTAAKTPPVLRCALWSDGTLELQRNGELVARLAEDEIHFVMTYMKQRIAA